MATTPKTTAKAAPKAPAKTAPKASAKTAAKPAAKKPAAPKAVKAAAPAPEAETLRAQASSLASRAGERVKDAANQGKDRATGALDDLSTMVEDVAKTLDEKLGAQYGDYARKAAGAVSGVAGSLKAKDVDELVDDARRFVKEKPAVAIGAAAALGFFLTRLVKAGSDDTKA